MPIRPAPAISMSVIVLRSDALRGAAGPMRQHDLQCLHEQRIHGPLSAADHRDPDGLEFCYQQFGEAA